MVNSLYQTYLVDQEKMWTIEEVYQDGESTSQSIGCLRVNWTHLDPYYVDDYGAWSSILGVLSVHINLYVDQSINTLSSIN